MILARPSVITDASLRGVVEDALSARAGRRRSVVALSRRPSAYYTSAPMEDLGLTLDDGTALSLVLKHTDPREMTEVARRAKPTFLLDPGREAEVYRLILQPGRVGAPEWYGAVRDAGGGACRAVVLEKVRGVPLWQVGDFAVWRAAAAWLAGLHGRLAASVASVAEPARLIRYDAAFYRLWPQRAVRTLRVQSSAPPAEDVSAFERLVGRYESVVERLLSLPATFIHGEYYPSNVLVQPRPDIRPVDWEMAAVGPGLMDLADLTAGKWSDDERAALADAYFEAATRASAGPSDRAGFEEDLNYCRLHRAVQWLGWAHDWSPPADHAQDWLSEALRLARALRLLEP